MGRLDRLLSLGQSDAIPDRLARQVRVTNALALLGVALQIVGLPLDVAGGNATIVAVDLAAIAAGAACLMLNARGHRTAARVLLVATVNAAMLGGVLEMGALPELRAVFFPLAILPFLVFGVAERGWLLTFAAVPVVAYFATAALAHPPVPGVAAPVFQIYQVYAPGLAFVMLVASAYVFAHVEGAAEDKVRAAQAHAAEGARLVALGEMSSGIAHEIRNPLTAIHLAATQIAERSDEPAYVAQLGQRIQRIVMRASRIIDALRSFARDASGDPFVATPVAQIVADSLELCGKRFADHGIELTVGAAPAGLVVECRAVQLAQVLVNLLGNAFDAVASAPERWVRIDVAAQGERLELAVTDSGPGIPAGAHLRIFEPFFTTKGPDRGTGIGLSLSRDLVAAHHGTLELDTAAPHTRFVIRLPLAQPRA